LLARLYVFDLQVSALDTGLRRRLFRVFSGVQLLRTAAFAALSFVGAVCSASMFPLNVDFLSLFLLRAFCSSTSLYGMQNSSVHPCFELFALVLTHVLMSLRNADCFSLSLLAVTVFLRLSLIRAFCNSSRLMFLRNADFLSLSLLRSVFGSVGVIDDLFLTILEVGVITSHGIKEGF
jgi:hypothetical protein